MADGSGEQDSSQHEQPPTPRHRRERAGNMRLAASGGRVYNSNNRQGRPARRPAGSGGDGPYSDGGAGDRPGGRRRRPGPGVELEDASGPWGAGGMSSLPPGTEFLLRDHEYFAEMAQQGGKGIDTSRMDDIDAWMATAFFESFKSSDGTYQHVVEAKDPRRDTLEQLPRPRSMAQLQSFVHEAPLRDCVVPLESEGRAVAQTAWQAIHQNVYYSDSDKQRMVNLIARLHDSMERQYEEKLRALTDATGEVRLEGVDLIHRAGFRPGRAYLEEELRLAALAGTKPVDSQEFVQSDTNWDVEAVEDEDQL